MSAVPAAATIEVFIAFRMVGSVIPVRYPFKPTPVQMSIARPLLNEYTTITRIGRNKNANTMMLHTRSTRLATSRRRRAPKAATALIPRPPS